MHDMGRGPTDGKAYNDYDEAEAVTRKFLEGLTDKGDKK
jgi:hypothetical protein